MARSLIRGWLALLFVAACGSEGASGPALEPRPEMQTCLVDLAAGMPRRLSETDCFADLKTLEPGPDLIPYEVSSALWTDGAFKLRYMVVPSPMQITVRADGSWGFPEGSVLIKVFGFQLEAENPDSRRAVETRFMVRDRGEWRYASYRWNDDGTDAERLDEGTTVDYVLQQGEQEVVVEYLFPSQEACTTCHGVSIDEVLGPKTSQMNRDHDYGRVVANQLAAMDEIDLLDFVDEVGEVDPDALPAMASPQEERGTLQGRARAYLDANCAHCHRPGGWAPSDTELDLQYETALGDTGLCEPMKYFQWEGTPRVAPGNPDGSGLFQRFVSDGPLRMPSLGTSVVDPLGVELLRAWISQLASCP